MLRVVEQTVSSAARGGTRLDSAPWHWSSSTSDWAASTSTTSRRGTCSAPSTREVSACTRPDTVLLLEHSSVYTAGKRTEPQERPLDGTPVIDVDRGGKITWHGPGQLVGYPIVRLPESVLVVDYVRRLEEAMIAMFAEFGLSYRTNPRPLWGLARGRGQAARAQDRGYRCPRGGRYDDARLCNQCRSRSSLVRSDHPVWLDRCGRYVHGRRAGHPRHGYRCRSDAPSAPAALSSL